MIENIDKTHCSGCTACAQICPVNCITMQEDSEGFLYAVADKNMCRNCGLCEKICPYRNSSEDTKKYTPNAFAIINSDKRIRESSSSGGLFFALASKIIQEGGVVFGVVMSENCKQAFFSAAETEEELFRMMGSKYMQAVVGDAYDRVQKLLEQKKTVLFSGTPCQITGLKAFLKKPYENLVTVDFICHGVPSPMVWRKYVDVMQEKVKAPLIDVSFRDKLHGWKQYGCRLYFSNQKEIYCSKNDDPFLQLFLKNLILRPSCYSCLARTKVRSSDITMADFWSIDRVESELNDDRGVSLALVNTAEGDRRLRLIQGCAVHQVPFADAVQGNKAYSQKIPIPKQREEVFSLIPEMSVLKIARKYAMDPWLVRTLKKIKKAFLWLKSSVLK